MNLRISECLVKPELDSDFIPAVKWSSAYRSLTNACDDRVFFEMALKRTDGTTSVYKTMVLPHTEEFAKLNIKYVERILKFLLWMKGGYEIFLEGDEALCQEIAQIYSSSGKRAFDNDFIGNKVYGRPMEFVINQG